MNERYQFIKFFIETERDYELLMNFLIDNGFWETNFHTMEREPPKLRSNQAFIIVNKLNKSVRQVSKSIVSATKNHCILHNCELRFSSVEMAIKHIQENKPTLRKAGGGAKRKRVKDCSGNEYDSIIDFLEKTGNPAGARGSIYGKIKKKKPYKGIMLKYV